MLLNPNVPREKSQKKNNLLFSTGLFKWPHETKIPSKFPAPHSSSLEETLEKKNNLLFLRFVQTSLNNIKPLPKQASVAFTQPLENNKLFFSLTFFMGVSGVNLKLNTVRLQRQSFFKEPKTLNKIISYFFLWPAYGGWATTTWGFSAYW